MYLYNYIYITIYNYISKGYALCRRPLDTGGSCLWETEWPTEAGAGAQSCFVACFFVLSHGNRTSKMYASKGSFEVKLLTRGTDGKAEMGGSQRRAEKKQEDQRFLLPSCPPHVACCSYKKLAVFFWCFCKTLALLLLLPLLSPAFLLASRCFLQLRETSWLAVFFCCFCRYFLLTFKNELQTFNLHAFLHCWLPACSLLLAQLSQG